MTNDITIIKPVITERSLADASKGIYTFTVGLREDKKSISRDIEELFKVHVRSITSVITKGRLKYSGKKRISKREKNVKKVRVTLAANEKIDLFEIGQSK